MEISKAIARHWALLLVAALVVFAIGWRLAPHMPNFAPVGAVALLAGVALGWRTALVVTLSMVALSDLVIGFYTGIGWTWLGFALIVGLGVAVKSLPLAWRMPLGAVGASIVFFIVSNFGTWLASGMYSHDIAGFIQCYVMALPFLKATLLSDLLFGSVLLGAHASAAYHASNSLIKESRLYVMTRND